MLQATHNETATDGPGFTTGAVGASSSGGAAAVGPAVGCTVCKYATQHGSYPAGPLTAGTGGHCDECHATWTGRRPCHCTTCHATFSAVTGFDRHRRRGKCVDPADVGLVDLEGVWSQPGSWPEDRRGGFGARSAGTEGPGHDPEEGDRLVSPRKRAGTGAGTVDRTATLERRVGTVSPTSTSVAGEAAA